MRRIAICFLLLLLAPSVYGHGDGAPATLAVGVADEAGAPLAYAVVIVRGEPKSEARTTDAEGGCRFTLPAGDYQVEVVYVGYVTQRFAVRLAAGAIVVRPVRLSPDNVSIGEVVVTASETKGPTSSSTIDRRAMDHLQPSSFADLMALLPGGSSSSPALGNPNIIHLREVGLSSSDENYNTSALGTAFVIDGAPRRNDANMQFIPQSGIYDQGLGYRTFQNKGVDMRTISTDDIEHVEIVRGIPSVEYGDLTSGLVKIRRRRGGRALHARFKADMSSKLLYLGKGFELPDRDLTINTGVDWLDAKSDPRNKLENYKRLTGSLRVHKRWNRGGRYGVALATNLDYTGSFDNRKADPESNNGNLDDYESKYNRLALSVDLDVTAREEGFFRGLEIVASADYSRDRLERRRFVQVTKPTFVPNSMQAGEHDAVLLPASFIGEMTVDGQPLSAYAKAVASFAATGGATDNRIILGADWALDKNLGRGQQYDPTRPVFIDVSTRPRPYDAIPAQHDLGLFVEDRTEVSFGRYRLDVTAGVRLSTMLNLPAGYALRGTFYADPRVNVGLKLPELRIGDRYLSTSLSGGVGMHTKTPTMSQLFPNPLYYDFVQLNYFHDNPALRRINLVTYVVDPTNYALSAARNFKWEVRGDLSYYGNRLSVTYFRENMESGFRSAMRYAGYACRSYDTGGLDHAALTAPPSLADLPYVDDVRVAGCGVTTNGSFTRKRGVEFTFSSPRIERWRTRLTVTGAWFRTEYGNSEPIHYYPGKTIDNKVVLYTGIYANDSRYLREMCNTNFMIDTDIPKLGMGLSLTFQCAWMAAERNTTRSGRPESYYGPDGVVYLYTDAAAADPRLATLIINYNADADRWHRVPFAMTTNLKVTKKLFGDKLLAAMFLSQMLNYTPSYRVDGHTVRRSATPYFGMEINFNL